MNRRSSYRSAIRLKPDFAEAYNNLGSTLLAGGNVPAALDNYRNAVILRPNWQGAYSNVLLAKNYICEDPDSLYADHKLWGENISGTVQPEPDSCNPIENRKIRIGFISPDFRTHSVARFLTAYLRNYDKSAFEIICFSDVAAPDKVTQEIKSVVSGWHTIFGISDDDVNKMVRCNHIDILVDLAGHTANNRLTVFAMRPAPVQVSYLGYPNTTGLSSIRYRITDKWADPPGQADNHHTEELVRLPGGFLCYTPPDDCPDVLISPILSNKHITYGSFNVLAKISDHCLQAWCEILKQTPGSRLILKSAGLQDDKTRAYFLDRFSDSGIDSNRIELTPRTTGFRSHMQLYNRVDISLDTFPYNGTTTTCESLWMGVPVITLAGNRHASRVGNSLLKQLGMNNLIAQDVKEYISLASELAGNSGQLEGLRESLRGMLASSKLCDGVRFTHNLEAAFRTMIGEHYGK